MPGTPDFALPLRDFVISGIQTPHGNFIGVRFSAAGCLCPSSLRP